MECEVSLQLSKKPAIFTFPKTDETVSPIPIPFLMYILISFFFVAYLFNSRLSCTLFRETLSKIFFLTYTRHMRCPFILLDLFIRVMYYHEWTLSPPSCYFFILCPKRPPQHPIIKHIWPISIVKPTRCTIFEFIEYHSTCFGLSFRPSSGV